MAWPRDARDKSYSALVSVPSSNLNAIQDAIIEVCEEQSVNVILGHSSLIAGTKLPGWEFNGEYWVCVDASTYLYFSAPVIEGAVLTEVHVKVYLATATGMGVFVVAHDSKVSEAGVAPTTAAIDSDSPAYDTAPAWDESSITGLSTTVAADYSIRVNIATPDVDDRVGGVRFVYYPYTHA